MPCSYDALGMLITKCIERVCARGCPWDASVQVPKAVLLEGSPGVGKTSLVAALAAVTGHEVRGESQHEKCTVSRTWVQERKASAHATTGEWHMFAVSGRRTVDISTVFEVILRWVTTYSYLVGCYSTLV